MSGPSSPDANSVVDGHDGAADRQSGSPIAEAKPEQAGVDEDGEQAVAERSEADNDVELSDNDSILSDLEDEPDFHDFDPDNLDIEERPAIAVDSSNVNLIGVHKRRRDATDEAAKKKAKEGRREKKPRRRRGDEGDDAEIEPATGLAGRRKMTERAQRPKKSTQQADNDDDESLTQEERRKRALDRKMDEALKRASTRFRKVDLEAAAEKEIENMRVRMIEAAQADSEARSQNAPAVHKLDILPQVVALLNRNSMAQYIVDPDTNLLEAVRFFLEPLADGSLPAHNIQKELFGSLANLPITKDTLVASGIGKVTIFYTKSTKSQSAIKRQAEALVQKWSRPILDNNAELRNSRRTEQSSRQMSLSERVREAERKRFLAMPDIHGRAKIDNTINQTQYTVAPQSEPDPSSGGQAGTANNAVMKRIMSHYTMRNGGGSRKRK